MLTLNVVDPPTGLSPRLRGNHDDSDLVAEYERSIPAPAGEPGTWWNTPAPRAVYPRACGGTAANAVIGALRSGLSPRLRGNLFGTVSGASITRSIPAPAGEPYGWTAGPKSSRVYPRACGGTPSSNSISASAIGLSPRLRGNLLELTGQNIDVRSIPAPAGEPVAGERPGRADGVYPRACGGTVQFALGLTSRAGLSPRLRGNLRLVVQDHLRFRSIPAPAGEPPPGPRRRSRFAVYPRACGGTSPGVILCIWKFD